MAIEPGIITFLLIPLSFFFIISGLFLLQALMVILVKKNLDLISFNHAYLFRGMNWWGIFIHELSHAVTAIITLNKVSEFKVTSSGGYVVHSGNGRGFFAWLARQLISIAPFIFPPMMAAILLKFSGYWDFHELFQVSYPTESVSIISALFPGSVPLIAKKLGLLFLGLDYSNIKNMLLLFVFIFSFSSARPSSAGGNGRQGDVQVLLQEFIRFPLYSILFFLFGILFFWLIFVLSPVSLSTATTFIMLLPILSLFGLCFNYIFVKIITISDISGTFHLGISLFVSAVVYLGMKQLNVEQYLINISSIIIFIFILLLSKRKI